MSVSGGGNLYPNWLGSASLSIPNNQIVVNGKVVNVVPNVLLQNQTIASVTANAKTLVYTLPGTYDAGVYFINAEFQVQNTGGGQTAFSAGDGIDWIVQGIGDAATDYAEGTTQPFYSCISATGSGTASANGVSRITPSGITQITNNGTQMGVYVKYLRAAAGTVTMSFTVATLCIQKIG
jgi:hypothetical protein